MCQTGPYNPPNITPQSPIKYTYTPTYPTYWQPPRTIEDRLDTIEKEIKELKEMIGRLK